MTSWVQPDKTNAKLSLGVGFVVAVLLHGLLLIWLGGHAGVADDLAKDQVKQNEKILKSKGSLEIIKIKDAGQWVQGSAVDVSFEVKYIGQEILPNQRWRVDFLLSTDKQPSDDDFILGSAPGNIDLTTGDQASGLAKAMSLPLDFVGTMYLIGVCRDGFSAGGQWYLTKKIEIDPMDKPDLQMVDAKLNFDKTGRGMVSYGVKNSGVASAVGAAVDAIVLSKNRSWSPGDIVVGLREFGANEDIEGGGTDGVAGEGYVLPALGYRGGGKIDFNGNAKKFKVGQRLFVLVITDFENVIDEGGREANNGLAIEIIVKQDKQAKKRFEVFEEKIKEKQKIKKKNKKKKQKKKEKKKNKVKDKKKDKSKLERQHLILGSDDGVNEPQVAWISHQDFMAQLRAYRSLTHQPALQDRAKARPEGDYELFASEGGVGGVGGGGNAGGGGSSAAKRSAAQQYRASIRKIKQKTKISEIKGASQEINHQPKSRLKTTKKIAGADEKKKKDQSKEVSVQMAVAEKSKRQPQAEDAKKIKNNIKHKKTNKSKPISQAKNKTKSQTPNKATQKKNKNKDNNQDKGNNKDKSVGVAGKGAAQGNEKGKAKGLGKGKGQGSGTGDTVKITRVPRDSSRLPATSLTDTPLDFHFGQVITMKGLRVDPKVPRFPADVLLSSRPDRPVYELIFDRKTGKVLKVKQIRSSGYKDIDAIIRRSLYDWRARGKKLKEMKTDFSIQINILVG